MHRPLLGRQLAFTLVACVLVACAHHRGVGSARSLIDADAQRAAAMVAADPVALEQWLHPRLVYTHSNGAVDTRVSLIETLLGGSIDYQAIESTDPTALLNGQSGVVTGPVRMRVEAAGTVHRLESLYTAVYWRERGGRWRMVAYQSTATHNAR